MTTVPLSPEDETRSDEARREALRKKFEGEGDSLVPRNFAPYVPLAIVASVLPFGPFVYEAWLRRRAESA